MSLWVPHCAFWNWQVNLGPPSLNYSYVLHAKYGVSKPNIIIYSCVFKSWFTFANLQSVSLKLARPQILHFVLHFVFEWQILAYIFAHWSNIGRINTETVSWSWKCYLNLWELHLKVWYWTNNSMAATQIKQVTQSQSWAMCYQKW